ncbi:MULTISPECIES: acyl-CoA dehydrogenase family protein [Sphingobium]|uniref:acyl-CoA dehydrogenase family protein n=1 Tax=Sphingobium TaxID=165695 RepID=UPI00159C3848|nr:MULTISPECIES: acyl-CoA dehydrogenase family protein [unclassified Sphingobium]
MDFSLNANEQQLRAEVRSFLTERLPERLRRLLHEGEAIGEEVWDDDVLAFDAAMVERGWQIPDLPADYGGKQMSAIDKMLLISEIDYANAPRFMRATVTSLVPTLARVGTKANKDRWLDDIVHGRVTLSIGYSEPEAGTDLANLRTRAQRDDDGWLINGMKCWNSRGHIATHVWLLARTGEPGGRHKGLSVFIVPLNAPGVQIQRVDSWGDHVFNDVFFADVRVPDECLIGEEGQGWSIVMNAVMGERSFLGLAPSLRLILDELVEYCRDTAHEGELLSSRSDVREALVDFMVDLELAEMMGWDIACRKDAGENIDAQALGLKIHTSELRTRIADFGMQLLGLPGLLRHEESDAPMHGGTEILYRRAPINRIGVGANEVMRDIVAQMGLGLPRIR